MIKRIHVNQHKIRYNKKHGTDEPTISVKCSKGNFYGHEVEILGPSKVLYRPKNPLPCGAQVWIESTSDVLVDGKTIS